MKKIGFYFCMIVCSMACSLYPVEVERALRLAGDNRTELEKVLIHYSQRPEDSLKLQSAYFLIANMPNHYTAHDERLESFKSYLKKIDLQDFSLANYEKSFGPVRGKTEKKRFSVTYSR